MIPVELLQKKCKLQLFINPVFPFQFIEPVRTLADLFKDVKYHRPRFRAIGLALFQFFLKNHTGLPGLEVEQHKNHFEFFIDAGKVT
jgi:hypothetical protein